LFSVYLLGCCVAAKEKETPEEQRKQLEPYMRDVVRLESTQRRGFYRIVSNEYSYRHKDESVFGFVFDEIIGSIVHAGYKTRQYHLKATHLCVGLKKLYLYWNNKTSDYRLTTNYLDAHNKGDRQPIGMCGAYKGHCGADLPLSEYTQSGEPDAKNDQITPSVYYGTSDENALGLSLKDPKTVCHIFSRSKEQVEKERKLDADTNFNWGTYHDRLVKVYSVYNGKSTDYFTFTDAKAKTFAAKSGKQYFFAFNLIKPESRDEISKICDLRPIARYSNGTEMSVLFDDPERDAALQKEGFKPYPDKEHYILGYGLQKNRYCGSRVRYLIQQRPDNGEVRAIPDQSIGAYNVSFHGGFFYSL